MSLISRPRPVFADLPLDLFLNPISDHPARSLNLPARSKRSRSPSLARSIFSPAKRRILEQEGLVLASRSRLSTSASTHLLILPHRTLLHAPDNPTHLHGGSLATGDSPLSTPVSHPDSLDLTSPREPKRTSPRLSASPCSSAATTPTRASPRRKAHPQTTTTTTAGGSSSSSSSRHVRHTTMVPREMPPPPDRRSLHYPGFDVHQDTHIALPHTRSMTRAREEAARVQEGEAAKENVRPAAGDVSCKKNGKAKGDVVPRRSARLRANNHPLLDVRGREHRRSVLYGVSLKV